MNWGKFQTNHSMACDSEQEQNWSGWMKSMAKRKTLLVTVSPKLLGASTPGLYGTTREV